MRGLCHVNIAFQGSEEAEMMILINMCVLESFSSSTLACIHLCFDKQHSYPAEMAGLLKHGVKQQGTLRGAWATASTFPDLKGVRSSRDVLLVYLH